MSDTCGRSNTRGRGGRGAADDTAPKQSAPAAAPSTATLAPLSIPTPTPGGNNPISPSGLSPTLSSPEHSPIRLATGSTVKSEDWVSFKNEEQLNPFEFMVMNNLKVLANSIDGLRDAVIVVQGRAAQKEKAQNRNKKTVIREDDDELTTEQSTEKKALSELGGLKFAKSIPDSLEKFKEDTSNDSPLKKTKSTVAQTQALEYRKHVKEARDTARMEAADVEGAYLPLDDLYEELSKLSDETLRDWYIGQVKSLWPANRISGGTGAHGNVTSAAADNAEAASEASGATGSRGGRGGRGGRAKRPASALDGAEDSDIEDRSPTRRKITYTQEAEYDKEDVNESDVNMHMD
ncbi:hypothetical protein Slin15195_G033260 [Septoria linicola]|uniref:Uncharacterized protein n=1 Tax=Septoria linicola TaxID=215465 RepID=A0A9Q9AQ36_9PEZI|nr:hypothetical protein Slin14017_G032280 [Septoria linicola]USW50007.1 hypothetical protein Slin15195_G033260 [Septoria linicola]